jgi:uncharacterized membrane protein YqjE
LRGLADSLLGSVQDRFELFTVELHEEKFRLIQVFIWISAAVFCAVMAVTLASITIVYLFWETARIEVLATLTTVYVASFVGVLWRFRLYLGRQPKPFSGTLNELKQDRACIRPQN